MTELQRTKRNEEKLLELFPAFSKRLSKVIIELEHMGLRPRIQDGYRSSADQLKAFNNGHSKLRYGFHNVTGLNGVKESLAVDLLDDDKPLNMSVSYLLKIAFVCEKNGLETGIRWGLPNQLKEAINNALEAKNFDAPIKVGWDPTHIQPKGITVAEAKKGKRPD